jgi:hypothetical protein
LEWAGGNYAARNHSKRSMKKSPLLTLGICAVLLVTDTAIGQTVKTIYFVRHAEDQLAVFQQGLNGNAYLPNCKPFMDAGTLTNCCTEVLNPLGVERARL